MSLGAFLTLKDSQIWMLMVGDYCFKLALRRYWRLISVKD